jgi:hypothetical protein
LHFALSRNHLRKLLIELQSSGKERRKKLAAAFNFQDKC